MEIDWMQLLKGSEDWGFTYEIIFRTIIMYVVILLALSILGKRGVKQLSVFELVIIIGLGSAAGDPMFYKEVGLLSGLTVFITIILLYKLTTYLVLRFEAVSRGIEGKAIYLVQNGKFSLHNFKKEPIAYDEFFSELRVSGISHLGQIDIAILEVSGEISVYFYEDKDVSYGLPILPHLYNEKHCVILSNGIYSCSYCGHTEKIAATDKHHCPVCAETEWVQSIKTTRVR